MWGGRIRRLPQDFCLHACNLRLAFDLWCRGDPAKGYPPLCQVQPIDTSEIKPAQKRFSEYRGLMTKIALQLKLDEKWIDNPTQDQVNAMYTNIRPLLPTKTKKGRVRRSDQLIWSTLVQYSKPAKPDPPSTDL
jgi:hypothetical protein